MGRRTKRKQDASVGGLVFTALVLAVCKVRPDLFAAAVQAVAEPIGAWVTSVSVPSSG